MFIRSNISLHCIFVGLDKIEIRQKIGNLLGTLIGKDIKSVTFED